MHKIKEIIDRYISPIYPEVKSFCEKCLNSERWEGNVVLMVIDASFNSIGLNYFKSVVPKVIEFKNKFGYIKTLKDLSKIDLKEAKKVWKNKRSWHVAINVAKYLSSLNKNDKEALRNWARNSSLENWKKDPIGSIKGVGINTFQYLRMMGGIDTAMPDRIVKKVINKILIESGEEPVYNDFLFIKKLEEISKICNYKPIELCWMTWLVESENGILKDEKYLDILKLI